MYILNLTMFILTPFYLFYNLDHSYFTFYLDCILLLPYIYTHWPLRSHFRNASEVQTEHQNEGWFLSDWMWHDCLCQTGWSENFRNCWSTGIFMHSHL